MKRDNFLITPVEVRHDHLFCGLGGGAKGFNKARPRVGNMKARFRCVGGIDVDPAGIRDFGKLAAVTGTVLDMFNLDQYLSFHGHMPPPGWREAVAWQGETFALLSQPTWVQPVAVALAVGV